MYNILSFVSGLKYFGYIVLAIAMLLVLVTVHEFGHYIAGRILKFKINEFSIGFGPKIFQKTKKNGELFTLRWFPLGGYCAFEGEDGSGDDANSFAKQPGWKRLIVLFAGPLFNFLSAFIFSFIFLLAVYKYSFWQSLVQCVPFTFDLTWRILVILGQLFTGQLGLDTLGGPVTTITTIADYSQESMRYFLLLLPLLSVNLGLFNLIPFPALDGCQMLFTLIEMIIRRPIKREVINIINTVGLFVLLGFVILVDILQFTVFR